MFFKILKKDLKRKKTMNILLLLFITLTATLLGSSINMLSTNSTVISHFMGKAKTPDFTAMTYYSEENLDKVNQWLSTSKSVEEYSVDTFILFLKSNAKLPEGKKPLDFDSAMAIQTVPKQHNLVFDESNEPLVVEAGQIAIPYFFSHMTDLVIGDKITISLEDRTREFTISHYIKDAFCGSTMMGFKRWIVNEEDYRYFDSDNVTKFNLVQANQGDASENSMLPREFNQLSVPSLSSIEKNVIEASYMMNTLIAGVIMALSLLLIFISLLMLRFTIGFTLQEDYKEIGIMKAIGLKNQSIQSIYMVKYLAMGLIGGAIGYVLSLPIGNILINGVCSEMVTEKIGRFNLPSLLGVALIILLTLAFCRLCTRKVNKLSAITAIRGGSTGERYHKGKKVSLRKWRTSPSSFLAISDLLHSGKKHIALFLSFILGTMVLIIPLNIINTMKSPALLELFGYVEFDFSVTPPSTNKLIFTYTTEQMLSYVDHLEEEYKQSGMEVELFPEVSYMSKIYTDDPTNSKNVYTAKSYGVQAKEYKMEEGTAPKLKNEVAMSTILADYYKVGVGDRLTVEVGDTPREYIITGIYSAMINLGENIRLPEDATYELKGASGLNILGRYKGTESEEKYMKDLQEVNKEYEVKTAQDFLHTMMGNIIDTLDLVNIGILIIVICINFLITILVGRMMLTKEAADIAVLKSLGYKAKSIRAWQIKRMSILLLVSVFIGTILANILGSPVANGIFEIMGATNLTLVVDPLQVAVIYPAIILTFTLLATLISTSDIKKIKVWEFNNQE